jgi:hypothetical protein
MNIEKRLISVNFTKGGNKKLGVCIHTMVGSLLGTDSHFKNPASQVSSHYGVGLDDFRVFQWVEEADQAWAQGTVDRPTAQIVLDRPGINPNTYLISIECADNSNPAGADRSKQYPKLIELVADICKRNSIPADKYHIVAHKEIRASKTCPGNINVNFIISEVKKLLGTPPESTMLTYFGLPTEADIKAKAKEHLGEKDGKCNWGAEPAPGLENLGGHLGAARREIKSLKASIVILNGEKAALTTQNSNYAKEVTDLKAKIKELESNPAPGLPPSEEYAEAKRKLAEMQRNGGKEVIRNQNGDTIEIGYKEKA